MFANGKLYANGKLDINITHGQVRQARLLRATSTAVFPWQTSKAFQGHRWQSSKDTRLHADPGIAHIAHIADPGIAHIAKVAGIAPSAKVVFHGVELATEHSSAHAQAAVGRRAAVGSLRRA